MNIGIQRVVGQVMGFQAQNKASWEQRAHNAKLEAINEKYRAELIQYQNVVYQQEVDYGGKMLDHQRSEFDRQGRMVENATESIQKNLFAKYGQLQRGWPLHSIFRPTKRPAWQPALRRRSRPTPRGSKGPASSSLSTTCRGSRGDNETVLNLNRSATMRQLTLEAMGLKASADQALYNIPIQTYAPVAPINPPSPVNPVRPEAPVASPNRGAMVANVVGAGIQGMSNHATWSGKKMSDVFSFK